MVTITSSGKKFPLTIIGNSQNPVFFQGSNVPVPYQSQSNGWFNSKIIIWWLHRVFWSFHLRIHGDVPWILIMDNCPVHKNINSPTYRSLLGLPKNLRIVFLPTSVTSRAHPADLGVISSLKKGYKTHMLNKLFHVHEETYPKTLEIEFNKESRGNKGFHGGGKDTVYDTALLLKNIWSTNEVYACTSTVLNSWKTSKLLPDDIFCYDMDYTCTLWVLKI